MILDDKYSNLLNYIEEVNKRYLLPHLSNPLAQPTDYEMDIRSFCVLCHAAFEDFIEELALYQLILSIDRFINERKICLPLLHLLHFKGECLNLDSIDDGNYDYIRKRLLDIKASFSKDIHSNHGIALKYLKQLFIPIGIDIPQESRYLLSLDNLVNARGSYAHKYRTNGLRVSVSPEDVANYIYDVLFLVEMIKDNIKSVLYFKYKL